MIENKLPFNIGDKVIVSDYSGDSEFIGVFKGQSETEKNCWVVDRNDEMMLCGGGQNGWWNVSKINDTITLITPPVETGSINTKNIMSIKNKIKMLLTGEPEKTLIKHGILTIDKELTSEGKELFKEYIEDKFKEEFLKGLYEVLKDEKLED
jgi:hypothetical protein